MNRKGQSLIELLVALSISVIIITVVSKAVISSLNNVQYSKETDQATQYASEGMEIVRMIRNNNYTGFKNYTGVYCLAKIQNSQPPTDLGSPEGSCLTQNVDNFIRSVKIEQNPGCGTNLAKVIVTVAWYDGKCPSGNPCNTVLLTSCFSTVNPIQAP